MKGMATRFPFFPRHREARFGQTLCAATAIHAAAFAVTSGVLATSVAVVEAPSSAAPQVETMLVETLPVDLEPLWSAERDTTPRGPTSTGPRARSVRSDGPDAVGPTRSAPQRPAQHRPAAPPSGETAVAARASDAQTTAPPAARSAVPTAPHTSSTGHGDAASARLTRYSFENLGDDGAARHGGAAAHGPGGSTAASDGSGAGSGRLLTPRLLAATYHCSDLFPYNATKDSQDLTLDLDVGPSGTARVRRVREARQVELDFVLAARSCARRLRFAPAKDELGQATQGRATLRLHFSRNRADG